MLCTDDTGRYGDGFVMEGKQKTEQKLRVLVACEESQRVCIEFRRLGHEAYSCDIEP